MKKFFSQSKVKKEAKVIAASLTLGLLLAFFVGAYTFVYSDAAQREIAENVLRFHINAHSDDARDLALKEEVRRVVLASLEAELTAGTTLDATRSYVFTRLHDIRHTAQAAVHQAGHEYPVTAEITQRFFPTTTYSTLTFPPGRYETLTLTIGDGHGRNWWCLMFPPLCYVEMTGTAQTRRLLEENLPAPGFALLTHTHEEAAPTVAVRFRLIEWWQNRRNPVQQNNGQHLQRAGR